MPKRSRRSRRRVTLFSRFRRELRTLSLADRCLFFMFLVLLVQSAAVMFSPPPEAGGEIDIIVRTSSASIFGYLLSGGLSGSAAGESASPSPADQCDAENHRQAFSPKRESSPVVFSAASAGGGQPIRKKSGGIRLLREKNAVLLA